MRQSRTSLQAVARVALAVFAASLAGPRSAFVYHEHAGGEHFHVHAEDFDAAPHEHHHHDRHHHAHHVHTGSVPGIEAPDAPALGHWHTQNPFHRTITPAPPTLPWVQIAEPRAAVADLGVDTPARRGSRARGPPSPAQ